MGRWAGGGVGYIGGHNIFHFRKLEYIYRTESVTSLKFKIQIGGAPPPPPERAPKRLCLRLLLRELKMSGGAASPAPAIQFVRVHYGDSSRIVTFYQDQPVKELRRLLGSLFPGTTSAAGRRPIAIERLETGVVVPLSSAAKFPHVMDSGNWDLLVSRETNVRTEKRILAGFLEDMAAHGFISPTQCETLNSLLNASDSRMLQAYRSFQSHRDAKQLKDTLLTIAEKRKTAASAVAASGVEDFFPRMIAFVEHLERVGMVTVEQAEVLYYLIDSGAAAVLAAYHSAREKNDPEALVQPLRQIADFYLEESAKLSEDSPGFEAEASDDEIPARPPTPTPYAEKDFNIEDPLDIIEMLVDAGMVSNDQAEPLRDLVVSGNEYVEAAIELFIVTGDAEDFLDTLQRIAPGSNNSQVLKEDSVNLARAAYEQQQQENDAWQSVENALSLISALTNEEVFSEAAGKRLSDLLTMHFGTSQQQVLIAAFQMYEQDGDVSEFVDTCVRLLKQIEKLASEHARAFALLISDSGSFSTNAQELLMDMWNAMEPRVMAAWDVFLEDKQRSDLEDTLSRIVALEFSIEEDKEDGAEQEVSGDSGDTEEEFLSVMRSVTELMIEEGHTDNEGVAVLVRLVEERNPVVLAAYDAFLSDEDVDELVDTLAHTIGYVQNNTDTLNCAELFDFVEKIVSNDQMTPSEGEVAAELIERRDPRVMAAYDVYFEDQDVHELIDTIERTVRAVRERKAKFAGQGSFVPEVVNDDADDADVDAVETLQKVVAAAYNTGKIDYETGVMLMNPSNMMDPRFLAALDTFAEEKDLEDLFDSLNRIGLDMIKQSATNAPAQSADEVVSSSVEDSELSADESALDTTVDYNQQDEDESSDSEWESDDENWDEEVPLPFSSSSSSSSSDDEGKNADTHAESNGYDHTYEELSSEQIGLHDADEISNLLDKLKLSDENMQQLSDLMNEGDPVVAAAFQVYEADGDVYDLRDTLLRILARVNFVKDSPSTVEPVSKVVSDLLKSNMINFEESEKFQNLLNDKHPVATAALELYGFDGDVEEFIDTMRRVY